jgi:hypothetical protein
MASKNKRVDKSVFFEIFAFEGCQPLSDDLVAFLISKGWPPYIFEMVKSSAPVEGCGVVAYYSKNRDSILYPGKGHLTTVEVTKTETHYYQAT